MAEGLRLRTSAVRMMYRVWVEDVWLRHRKGNLGRPLCRRGSKEKAFAVAGWMSGPETGYGAMVVEDPDQGLVWRVRNGEVT